jgi:GDP-L-fucose synthase
MKYKIFITGHNGIVGSAIDRLYKSRANFEIITESRKELDLRD